MQVFDQASGRMVKQDRQWGKTLTDETSMAAFARFANNGMLLCGVAVNVVCGAAIRCTHSSSSSGAPLTFGLAQSISSSSSAAAAMGWMVIYQIILPALLKLSLFHAMSIIGLAQYIGLGTEE